MFLLFQPNHSGNDQAGVAVGTYTGFDDAPVGPNDGCVEIQLSAVRHVCHELECPGGRFETFHPQGSRNNPALVFRGAGPVQRNVFGSIPGQVALPEAGSAVYGVRVHVAAKASSLLENLLLWSLSQKGMLEPVMREEDLAALAAEAIGTIPGGEIITVDIPSDLAVRIDRNMLLTR